MIPTLFDKMRANRRRVIVVWPKKKPPRGWFAGDYALHVGHPEEFGYVKIVERVDAGWLVFHGERTAPKSDYTHCDVNGNRMFLKESE